MSDVDRPDGTRGDAWAGMDGRWPSVGQDASVRPGCRYDRVRACPGLGLVHVKLYERWTVGRAREAGKSRLVVEIAAHDVGQPVPGRCDRSREEAGAGWTSSRYMIG